MVKIIAIHLRESEKGKFVSLEIMGDVELVQSQNNGRFYATAKKCFISSTFTHEVAKGLLGQELPGTIARIGCDPYSYILPESGEAITLSHSYTYVPPQVKVEQTGVDELQLIV